MTSGSKKDQGEQAQSLFTDQVKELVAIGAAIACNCEMCFKHHYNEARKLGVTKADMRRAVEMAVRVKETPAMEIAELAERYLRDEPEAPCCCGPSVPKGPGTKSCC